MRVLVTRPVEDAAPIAARLSAIGHVPLLAPLLATRFFAGPEPDFRNVQAILATSANGVRALVRRSARRDLPLFAVGPQTSEEARKAGFTDVRNADGDAVALAAATACWATPEQGALLHACGQDADGKLAALLQQDGFTVRKAVLYAVDPAAALPEQIVETLQANAIDAALFFSPRSARIFCDLAAGLPLQGVTAFAISPATAAVLEGKNWRGIRIAPAPNQDALLAVLEEKAGL